MRNRSENPTTDHPMDLARSMHDSLKIRPRIHGFRDYAARDILRLQQQSRSVAMASFPLVSATGMLGSGFRAESLDKAISLGARMIGCDAGSTDPGPGPLATGTWLFSAAAGKRDPEIMMTCAIKAGIPLIIGSARHPRAGGA